MHGPIIKQKVQALRKNAKSIGYISEVMNLSKSTVSFWCRDIKLSEKDIKIINRKAKTRMMAGLLRYGEIKRKERINRTQAEKILGKTMIGTVSDRDILLAGLGLYWGEGYKESNGELGFTNSNPLIIGFYLKWLSLLEVKKENLIFRLTMNKVFSAYEKNIKDFWFNLLKVKENQFSKTTFIKTNLKKASINNLKNYHGILRIKVRKGLSLKNKILGAIEYIAII